MEKGGGKIEFKLMSNKVDEYDEGSISAIINSASIKTEVITLDLDNGNLIRGYSVKSPESDESYGAAFKFVVIEWKHPNHSYFSEAGFFYKSMYKIDWEIVPLSRWMCKYKTKDNFLEVFPQFNELF